ncbi:MAG: preprotein translocase subunit SecG [Betaproteobacteria bacterium]|nr:preprotein translocase subunit SecG [Betaproteobacteria bacterium]
MDIWLTLILTVHVLVALGIIFLVLLQHGKGADMGAAFGSGSSGSLFGSTGSANFLSRTTAALAAVFFLTSLGLAYVATHKPKTGSSVMQGVTAPPAVVTRPAEDVPKPADAPKPANVPAGSKANDVPK